MIFDSSGIRKYIPEYCQSEPDGGIPTYLAQIFSEAEKKFNGTVMIIGGDTLSVCLNRIGCRELRPVKELLPGVVLSTFRSEGRDKLIISKSGGFGDEELLVRLRSLIRDS